jgi:OOP family OmpA-OmpF porin
MKNTTTIRTTLVLAAALGLMSSTMAFAQQGRSTQGYLTDQRNGIVKDPFNLCWRTGYWTPALSNCDCDVDLLPRDVCFPPAPKPAAAPPPPPPPPPVAAKPPAPKTLAVSSTGLFDFDKAVLTDNARAQLDKEVVARLGEFSSLRLIHVEGHTDRIGTQEYNQKLSERRADAVKAYLVSRASTARRSRRSAWARPSRSSCDRARRARSRLKRRQAPRRTVARSSPFRDRSIALSRAVPQTPRAPRGAFLFPRAVT